MCDFISIGAHTIKIWLVITHFDMLVLDWFDTFLEIYFDMKKIYRHHPTCQLWGSFLFAFTSFLPTSFSVKVIRIRSSSSLLLLDNVEFFCGFFSHLCQYISEISNLSWMLHRCKAPVEITIFFEFQQDGIDYPRANVRAENTHYIQIFFFF